MLRVRRRDVKRALRTELERHVLRRYMGDRISGSGEAAQLGVRVPEMGVRA